jgi:folate-binding protein YgfZ
MSASGVVAALHEGAAIFRRTDRGVIAVRGSDRVRFLQGQLTNDVASLEPDGPRTACPALVLTREGRIVAEFHVIARADAFWLETDAAAIPPAMARLEKFVIADDVVIADASAAIARLSVEGARAFEAVGEAAGVAAFALESGSVATLRIGEADVLAGAWSSGSEAGVQLFAARDEEAHVLDVLRGAGARLGVVEADLAALEILRVEAGLPRFGAELGPDTLPAELGLVESRVSFTKGCYTGQEVVARMHSRGRVGHRLIGIVLDDGTLAESGAEVRAGGSRVGAVTSVARSPRCGAIALGIVRNGFDAPGTPLDVGGRSAQAATLPFVSRAGSR